MKIIKSIALVLTGILFLAIILAYAFDVDYLLKAVRTIYLNGHTTAFLEDYKHFNNRTVASGNAQPWPLSSHYNRIKPSSALEKIHKETKTVAFLVIQNDSIVHEAYYDDYNKNTLSNSFSMAKSIVSAAMGKAIMQRKIKGLGQPVSDFFPQYKTGKAAQLTVGDLSAMSSGLDWDERYYSPFSITTRAYFDDDLPATILKLPISEAPGKEFKYLSGNTQLLAMVLEKAVKMPLSDYVSENFWKPMGAAQAALWQTDREDGMVKAFCCFASTARDFARFGKLYMQNGKWNGVQLLDSAFVAKSITPHFPAAPQYGYGWWLGDYNGKDMYYMRGHLGQYTIVIPSDKIIIVRLGHQLTPGDAESIFPMGMMAYIDGAYKMLKPQARH